MTGLDRLRELADDMFEKDLWVSIRGGIKDKYGTDVWDDKTVNCLLCEIADQIEAEQEERVTRRVEDREAAEWVREHGGLEGLSRLFQDADNRRVELCAALGIDLDKGWSEAMAAMRLRLMPEGCEWPRYEDGKPFIPGDDGSVEFFGDGIFNVWINGDHQHLARGERVKRPAVLAADDEPLEAGQTVWHIDTGDEFHVSCFSDGTVNVSDQKGGGLQLFPSQLTHQRPVLDADGNRIETGMDVWWVCEGDERGIHAEKLHVEGIDEDGMVECSPYNGGTWVYLDSSELYVKKPVLDADGAPIHEGDTVYGIGRTQHVFVVLRQPGLGGGNGRFKIACHDVTDGVDCDCDPSLLTHTKPEPPDTWDQIKADADLCPFNYVKKFGKQPEWSNAEFQRKDLVRRCKELAEKGETK